MKPFHRHLSLLALAAVLLVGCDNAAPTEALDRTPDDVDMAAAETIAGALADETGGVFHHMAGVAAVLAGDPRQGHGNRPGCETERSWDAATETWTHSITCERGRPDGPAYMMQSRVDEIQYRDASGVPMQFPVERDPDGNVIREAVEMSFDIVSGSGVMRTPRARHYLTNLGASWIITDINTPMVNVNGDYTRAGADSVMVPRGRRYTDYTLDLAFTDVRGPRGVQEHWQGARSGRIDGHYVATITLVTPQGTQTQNVDRTFTINFPLRGDVAVMRLAGRDFHFNVRTGAMHNGPGR
jgi:hypothetical protein